MKAMDFLREEEVILALRENYGHMELTAKSLGCSRGQLQNYLMEHPEVRQEKAQIKEALIDTAEEHLVERMKESDSLLMFFLRTQAKHRGYDTSNREVTMRGPNGGPIDVRIDARALIAAMRNGTEVEEEDEDSQDGDLQQLSDFRDN